MDCIVGNQYDIVRDKVLRMFLMTLYRCFLRVRSSSEFLVKKTIQLLQRPYPFSRSFNMYFIFDAYPRQPKSRSQPFYVQGARYHRQGTMMNDMYDHLCIEIQLGPTARSY